MRSFGAPYSHTTQEAKAMCLIQRMAYFGWQVALWCDVGLVGGGVKWFEWSGKRYWLIHEGLVAVVLDERWMGRWRDAGGAKRTAGRGAGADNRNRAMALDIAGQGGRCGLTVVAGYAPVFAPRKEAERQQFHRCLRKVVRGTPRGNLLVVGGDMNVVAALGNDRQYEGHVGPGASEGLPRGAQELMETCMEEGLAACSTWYQQSDPSTWYHPRSGTAAKLTTSW